MSANTSLLIEIGCEEIPARMIPGATADLAARLVKLLEDGGLAHGPQRAWGGSRRLAVHIESVQDRQSDRQERVLGPPSAVAFDGAGEPTRAATGFAAKQGVEASRLERVSTERGEYVGFTRDVRGRTVGELLAAEFPGAVTGMSFPKTMRWGVGSYRWVRPVHWLVALHGTEVLPLSVFGIEASRCSRGHRFLSDGEVQIPNADAYTETLEAAKVVVDGERRATILAESLERAANELGGSPVPDTALLAEVANLVEWPGVVAGGFDPAYLDLPRELLVTTLRHHQKAFSVQNGQAELLPGFLGVANTDRDPEGHVRRGNEWVVGGRLDDARFFWNEDRKASLADRSGGLSGVVLHAKIGSYADKAGRMRRLATELAGKLGLKPEAIRAAGKAAFLAKNDLLTGTVGEFPELQGRVGGLMLRAEGESEDLALGVYEQYQPSGPADPPPDSATGSVVSIADKLDSVAVFVAAGLTPTGSRDPYGLRRAANGVLRALLHRDWPLSLADLIGLVDGGEALRRFLKERLIAYLRDAGYAPNEVQSVVRPRIDAEAVLDWALPDVVARLDAIARIRGREDFLNLVKLTERVDTILQRNAQLRDEIAKGDSEEYAEQHGAAVELARMVDEYTRELATLADDRSYPEIVESFAALVAPVEKFFQDVLVIDPTDPAATLCRYDLLSDLRGLLTRYFDIRELAGQAERR